MNNKINKLNNQAALAILIGALMIASGGESLITAILGLAPFIYGCICSEVATQLSNDLDNDLYEHSNY